MSQISHRQRLRAAGRLPSGPVTDLSFQPSMPRVTLAQQAEMATRPLKAADDEAAPYEEPEVTEPAPVPAAAPVPAPPPVPAPVPQVVAPPEDVQGQVDEPPPVAGVSPARPSPSPAPVDGPGEPETTGEEDL